MISISNRYLSISTFHSPYPEATPAKADRVMRPVVAARLHARAEVPRYFP